MFEEFPPSAQRGPISSPPFLLSRDRRWRWNVEPRLSRRILPSVVVVASSFLEKHGRLHSSQFTGRKGSRIIARVWCDWTAWVILTGSIGSSGNEGVSEDRKSTRL